jgi:hypothetical protein
MTLESPQTGHIPSVRDEIRDRVLLAQVAECWADLRNFDVIVWQIPAAVSAIGGLMVTGLLSEEAAGRPWARCLVALGAAFVTFPLVIALVKNRIFQVDRNNWRLALLEALLKDPTSLPKIREYHPESQARDGIVLLSSRDIHTRFGHGPWYWRASARMFKRVSAYNVLFAVSLMVLAGEFLIGVYFGIAWLRPDLLQGLV